MTRNTKPEYIKKLLGVTVNGFKVDIGNYLYNPAHGYEYPSLIKKTGESDDLQHYVSVKYFKYHDGTGKYSKEVYAHKKDHKGWSIAENRIDTVVEESNRFSFSRLQELAKVI